MFDHNRETDSKGTIREGLDDNGQPLEAGAYYTLYNPMIPNIAEPSLGPLVVCNGLGVFEYPEDNAKCTTAATRARKQV